MRAFVVISALAVLAAPAVDGQGFGGFFRNIFRGGRRGPPRG